jgi:phospholipase C
MPTDRRTFLQLLSSSAAAAAFPASIARALEIPAHSRTGTIDDVEHIVFLMQENRSFDHYFGTLRGVRGFGDPRAVTLASGDPVWQQPNGSSFVLPFHPTAPDLGLKFLEDLAHDWITTHDAWNQGQYDQWVPAKTQLTMAHLTRNDIPFHYALADAFTVCDAYHCSLLGPTDPNRYHMWTGWVGNDGSGGGPVVDNAEAGYGWYTYPERLQKAGVSWKVYQDIGLGLNAANFWGFTDDAYIGNFGDTSLLYFHQYQNAPDSSPLAQKARTGTNIAVSGSLFDSFAADVKANKLPQVSWVVAPEAYSEHPNWPANFGAWYVSQVLDALTANPEVWSKTAFFLMYDENDGFFDHVVPPTPPQTRAQGLSTVPITNEIFPGSSVYPSGPYGLGVRVPMIVISPWSKGGWVNSEVFDHTSMIQFLEKRFGVSETNITPWRRAVTGDLTSAFNFKSPNAAVVPLPSTTAFIPPDNKRHPDFVPAPPAEQVMPQQESGTRPARAVPYELHADASVEFAGGVVTLSFRNTGAAAAVFQVRSNNSSDAPRSYTVAPNVQLSDTWAVGSEGLSAYDLSVYGPNGFFRRFAGSLTGSSVAALVVEVHYDRAGDAVQLLIHNAGKTPSELTITDAYAKQKVTPSVHGPGEFVGRWELKDSFDWYDLVIEANTDPHFRWQIAGHLETGKNSVTDPAIGAAV